MRPFLFLLIILVAAWGRMGGGGWRSVRAASQARVQTDRWGRLEHLQ